MTNSFMETIQGDDKTINSIIEADKKAKAPNRKLVENNRNNILKKYYKETKKVKKIAI